MVPRPVVIAGKDADLQGMTLTFGALLDLIIADNPSFSQSHAFPSPPLVSFPFLQGMALILLPRIMVSFSISALLTSQNKI